jgi:hypothetical protein
MTTSTPVEEFDVAWAQFVTAIGRLLQTQMSQVKAAKFAHFRRWSDGLLGILSGPEGIASLQAAWQTLHQDVATREAAELILMELQAFNSYASAIGLGIDVSTPEQREQGGGNFVFTDAAEDAKEGLGIAKTLVESIKEMFDDLPRKWKILLKSLGELLEIGKGFF